jgi:hypothetical protein
MLRNVPWRWCTPLNLIVACSSSQQVENEAEASEGEGEDNEAEYLHHDEQRNLETGGPCLLEFLRCGVLPPEAPMFGALLADLF